MVRFLFIIPIKTAIYKIYLKEKKQPERYRIYIGKRSLKVECVVSNFDKFELKMKKKLRKANNRIEFETKIARFV